jgi:hypothetical protein
MSSLSDRISSSTAIASTAEQPAWYVTNGDRVVGPLETSLLLRGIAHGRVHRECVVAQHSWSKWRDQNCIREIRSLRRWQFSQRKLPDIEPVQQALRAPRFDAGALESAACSDDVLGKALEMAVRGTRASVGILHQPRAPFVGLVTSFAYGPGMGLNLGDVVSGQDEARGRAALDHAVLGEPNSDSWARASARRLSTSLTRRVAGVAVVTVDFGGVRGLIELGRYDHTFRQSDVAVLADLGSSLERRLRP